jgi:hypothetical protein
MKCSNQSFHLPKSYKGKNFIGCNYFGIEPNAVKYYLKKNDLY